MSGNFSRWQGNYFFKETKRFGREVDSFYFFKQLTINLPPIDKLRESMKISVFVYQFWITTTKNSRNVFLRNFQATSSLFTRRLKYITIKATEKDRICPLLTFKGESWELLLEPVIWNMKSLFFESSKEFFSNESRNRENEFEERRLSGKRHWHENGLDFVN